MSVVGGYLRAVNMIRVLQVYIGMIPYQSGTLIIVGGILLDVTIIMFVTQVPGIQTISTETQPLFCGFQSSEGKHKIEMKQMLGSYK